MANRPRPSGERRRGERAILLQLLGDEHSDSWTRAELDAKLELAGPVLA